MPQPDPFTGTAEQVHRLDQLRASLADALANHPCTCGDCLTDDEVQHLLALDDSDLWSVTC